MKCHQTASEKMYPTEECYTFKCSNFEKKELLQVKVALQGVFNLSNVMLHKRVIHLKRVTLQREDPLL